MFMNQIPSLRSLKYTKYISCFSGASKCLKDLSELHCCSSIPSEFFCQLSQISCHNLRSLSIDFDCEASNGLKELIHLQNNLKDLNLLALISNWIGIIPALTKHSNTLTKLHLDSNSNEILPLSFVASLKNLQEIKFSFFIEKNFEDFKKLQYVNFPKLQILDFPYNCPKPEYMMNFLEINGKNLKQLNMGSYVGMGNALNLSIIKYCPNLKKLSKIFDNDESDALRDIFDGCNNLESIKFWCGKEFLNEAVVLKTVAKYSPKNFCELKLYNVKLQPEDLESFLISWKNRPSKKSLNLVIIERYCDSIDVNEKNMEIIERYKNLGIIKFESR
ncbi:hypothetical protein C1645_845925 [Glomus cerebriforme]|uniref:F-box domain-containing protein n=1 Tax=Glomus cerebriforme TaxID=658196 RepID=A0A397TBG2_9GLOM|nr:hypothetical protein C1645_845925 [Glomus cerebriforme]